MSPLCPAALPAAPKPGQVIDRAAMFTAALAALAATAIAWHAAHPARSRARARVAG
jgi:hypothetical protein